MTKPKIERIELTQDQKADIKCILNGEPSKQQLTKWEKIGYRPKYYRPAGLKSRINRIKQKYFRGLCCICQKFPLYKIMYKIDSITLVEYYCQEHFDKITT